MGNAHVQTTPVRSRDELLKEARSFQDRMKAAGTVPEKDPAEAGTVSAPSHPDGDDPKKLQVPTNSRPTNDKEQDDGASTQNPGPSGTDPVSTANGDAVDARFTSPTSPIEKGASPKVRAIAEEAQQILHKLASYSATVAGDAPATIVAPVAASAGSDAIGDMHMKVSAALFSTERGVALVEEYLSELRGSQDAQAMIQKAASDQAVFQKVASDVAQVIQQRDEQFHGQIAELNEIYKVANTEQRARLETLSQIYAHDLANLDPRLHDFYKAGAADAANGMAAMAEGGEFAVPGGEGDLDPAQLEMIIQQLVEAGQLDPAMAQELMAQLTGGGGAPVEGGAMPDEAAMMMEGALAEGGEALPEEVAKAASFANSLLASL